MSFAQFDFLRSLDLGDINDYSFTSLLENTNFLNVDSNEPVRVFTLKRRMPYLENFRTLPTTTNYTQGVSKVVKNVTLNVS